MNSEKNTHPDNQVLVCVEGVSKKFCRSLKKSLWYGLCDIGGEVAARQIGEANPKGETSWQRANQCLGLIRHNGAGTQAANVAARTTAVGSPEGETPLVRINTTLLKMLNGLIKPDAGTTGGR